MITAEELRKIMQDNKSTIYPKEVAEYCLNQLDQELKEHAKLSSANHYSYWLDGITDKDVQNKLSYCKENDILPSVFDKMEDALVKSHFSVTRLFNGISLSW